MLVIDKELIETTYLETTSLNVIDQNQRRAYEI